MPNATERTVGIASVMTRRPPGSTVRRTSPPSASFRSVRVVNSGVDRRVGNAVTATGRSRLLGCVRAVAAVLEHRYQRELAARVDLGDLDLHLVADLDDVLDVLDALA